MEDVLDIYEKPLDPTEPVVCIDEKPVQLISEVRQPLPLKPFTPLRRDNEYKREGVGNVFCIVEPKVGRHLTYATNRRTAQDFAVAMKTIANAYPDANTIHIVMDNLNTHKANSLVDAFGERAGVELWSRFTPHYTPKHGSWLNQAEIECSMFSRMCLGNQRVGSLSDLVIQTRHWNRLMNRQKVTIDWKFTKEKARHKFKYRK